MFKIFKLFCAVVAALGLCMGVAAAAEKEMQIGFVYVSPVGDEGWSYAHDQARKELNKMPGVKTSMVESVPEGPDAGRVFMNMARNKYDIIFGTSFGYMDPMVKVAKDFPNTTFMHCSGYKNSDNMSNYFGRIYQARYLTGIVAGKMTKTNNIGYVAAYPIPEVLRGINAFTLGVQSVNPKAEVRVVWTKSWYDPALEKEAAKSLLDVGVDVIAQHQDSSGPQEAAEERGVYSVGYNTDMSRFAPKAHLTSAVWNWTDVYKNMLEQVRAGTWKNGSFWYGIETGVVDIAPFGSMVPQEVRDITLKAKEDIKSGKLVVFKGPVVDQAGKVRIADGAMPEDSALQSIDYLVKGVIGTTK